jgi:hypothetical protein
MAWHFDEVDDRVQVADHAALSFPAGDWTIAGWVRLDDNSGTAFQYFISWGAVATVSSFNLYFNESGQASPNAITMNLLDDAGIQVALASSATPGTNLNWQHIAVIHDGIFVRTYVDGIEVLAVDNASFGALDEPGTWFFGGSMAEGCKWDRALSLNELTALVNGAAPVRFLQWKWYIPMHAGQYAEYGAGLVMDNFGSTSADHAPVAPQFGFSGTDSDAGVLGPTGQPFRPRGMMVPGFAGGRFGRVA